MNYAGRGFRPFAFSVFINLRVWELTVGVVAVGGVIPATGGVNGELECESQSDV